jgi:uncharacterized Rmd1/YagE family protein
MPSEHRILALAFPENFALKDLARSYPAAAAGTQRALHVPLRNGEMSLYPFGAAVFRDVPPDVQEAELARLRGAVPKLQAQAVEESFVVREDATVARPRAEAGTLVVDVLTDDRARTVALVVAQSAAMEYYEKIADGMFGETERLADRLEQAGTVSLRVRSLHRFIGRTIGTRNEVLSVLHLLDKPDETWDDPTVDRIYDELRVEFDLLDRYQALEAKLRSTQEALELVLEVARDRRLVVLEAAIVVLIVIEIVLSLVRH